MNTSNQIKELINHSNSSTAEVANRLKQSQSNLLNKLTRDNLRISELEEIANALDYTDMEIILRGSKEDAIIFEDRVEYKPHNVYMMLDKNKDFIKEIEEHGLSTTKFKDVVFDLVEEKLKPLAGDLWEVTIPNISREIFISMALALLLKMSITEEELESNADILKRLLDDMKK